QVRTAGADPADEIMRRTSGRGRAEGAAPTHELTSRSADRSVGVLPQGEGEGRRVGARLDLGRRLEEEVGGRDPLTLLGHGLLRVQRENEELLGGETGLTVEDREDLRTLRDGTVTVVLDLGRPAEVLRGELRVRVVRGEG